MAKEKLYDDVPKLILEHYDMFMDTRMTVRTMGNNHILIIYNWIVFTPKEVNEFTPKTVNFYDKHKASIFGDLVSKSYEDARYIRALEMPLLKYIQGEYYMDEFCEKLSNNKVDKIIEDFVNKKDVNVPLIFTIGSVIYSDYYTNNF
jgi:hypothetical protein